jgi:hypothetical protein
MTMAELMAIVVFVVTAHLAYAVLRARGVR